MILIIKSRRKLKGLSQKDLARKLRVTQSYISRVESKKVSSVTTDFILNLSNVLNIPAVDIFIFLTNCSEESDILKRKYQE